MIDEKYYKVCFHCGNFVHESEKDVYCSVCGNKLETECSVCHEKIRNPFARYCPNCGAPYIYLYHNQKKKEL